MENALIFPWLSCWWLTLACLNDWGVCCLFCIFKPASCGFILRCCFIAAHTLPSWIECHLPIQTWAYPLDNSQLTILTRGLKGYTLSMASMATKPSSCSYWLYKNILVNYIYKDFSLNKVPWRNGICFRFRRLHVLFTSGSNPMDDPFFSFLFSPIVTITNGMSPACYSTNHNKISLTFACWMDQF